MLSVCIVNWNTCGYLRDCLTSLYAYPPAQDELEVVVVDNASTDGSAAMAAAEFPQAALVPSDKNLGYARGCNAALTRARGDWLLLLNPDVIVHPSSLTAAAAFGRAHPDAAAIGARLLGTDGITQRSVRAFPDPVPVLWEFLGLSRLLPWSRRFGAYRMTYFDYDRTAEVDQPMGTFLLIPRRALDDVGLMDQQFPIFFNEVDWCWRAKRERGWKIYYTPEVVVTHYGGGSTRQAKARMMIQESHRSLLRFYEKHYKRRITLPLYLFITQAVLWNERRLVRAAQKSS
jgi:hypothetical protein